MLQPKQDESQPEFAIRFHEATIDEIPDFYARNKACDAAWEDFRGELPERAQARGYFDVNKYEEAEDVVVFCEHAVPDSVSPDGSAIPGTYDRYSLAAMCESMNSRIRDVDGYSPISKGHTQKSGPEPELMGYTGAMRLGMIGREKPRFAILTDEYRRLDKKDDFKALPGRSPEVWKYPRFEDRFFAPIAALGVTTPRLDLPPAKYSAIDHDGLEVAVDRYSRSLDDTTFDEVEIDKYMTAMGGSNGFAPGMGSMGGQDHYGDDEDLPRDDRSQPGTTEEVVQQVIDGLMQTQPMQFLLQLMQTQDSGMAKPMVQQPVDPVEELPGQNPGQSQQMGQPPQPSGGGGMQPPQPPGGGDMQDPQRPPIQQGQYEMSGETEHYERPSDVLKSLKAENEALKTRLAALEGTSNQERYSRELDRLAETHVLNKDAELERLCAMDESAAKTHLNVIKENYARNLTGIEEFDTHRPDGQAADKAVDANAELDESTADAVAKYAMAEGLEYGVAREKYFREQSASK